MSEYVDEIAVMRALEGDRKVYESLTRAEQRQFYLDSYKKAKEEGTADFLREDGDGGGSRDDYNYRLADWLGIDVQSLKRGQERAVARERA